MELQKLVDGFTRFRARYFETDRKLFSELVENGQKPMVVLVACADSRVSPNILLEATPGDLFVLRNIANHIPPPSPGMADSAIISGLEYAILGLEVRHAVVMGHSRCGGVRALMDAVTGDRVNFPHVESWMADLEPACRHVIDTMPNVDTHDMTAVRAVEQAAVVASLDNLYAYPWVRSRVDAGLLKLHGWYFQLAAGRLWHYVRETGRFEVLVGE